MIIQLSRGQKLATQSICHEKVPHYVPIQYSEFQVNLISLRWLQTIYGASRVYFFFNQLTLHFTLLLCISNVSSWTWYESVAACRNAYRVDWYGYLICPFWKMTHYWNHKYVSEMGCNVKSESVMFIHAFWRCQCAHQYLSDSTLGTKDACVHACWISDTWIWRQERSKRNVSFSLHSDL